jgi:putative ABC transport system permease protein
VINEAAARRYFPNESPIGRRIGSSLETSGQIEIVGVVRDTKYHGVREAAPPTLFVPHLQTRTFGPTFTVRTAGDPLAAVRGIREAVRRIDSNLPIADVSTHLQRHHDPADRARVGGLRQRARHVRQPVS